MMRRILFAIALLLSFGLAACNAIPNSGPVREGLTNLDQGERIVILNPSGPAVGADPESIVVGFVRAASSNANNYEIAREFLAPTYSDQWDPWLGALVYEGSPSFLSAREGIATLSVNAVATVDSHGTMTPTEPDRQTELQFELTRVGGEWRISSAPAGIILDRNNFTTVWTTRPLYFLSPDDRLVSDTRWFLNRPTLTTQIMQEVIAGPKDAMVGAISTAFPAGITLTSGTVPVVDGAAIIDVTAELFEVDDSIIEQIKRQIVASLQSVPGVTRYELTVHGNIIASGDVLGAEDVSATEQQSVIVLSDGQFGVAISDGVRPIEGVSDIVSELDPTAATVSLDRTAAVIVHSGGVSWVSENEIVTIDDRRGVLTPSLDPLGYVWVYSPNTPGELWVSRPGVDKTVMSIPWLEDRDAVAVRVSMGGNRLAALVKNGEGSELLVAGIVRDANGKPTGTVDTVTVQLWDQGAPIDFDWIGDTRFATLTQAGLLGGSGRITTSWVGQFASESGAVSGGVSISGGGRLALLRVLDDQGRMFEPQGQGWQQLLGDVELLSKVG